MSRFSISVRSFVVGAACALAMVAGVRAVTASGAGSRSERLQRLEDVQQIRNVLNAYGATLDRHDFAAFGRLFTRDAVYGGVAAKPVVGRKNIAAALRNIMAANPSHLPAPDFHLFFNQSIHVNGNRATATSKGAYVVPNLKTQRAEIVFLVSYDDTLVRRDGHWLFQRRIIHPGIPQPSTRP